jgi:hypothetical protein
MARLMADDGAGARSKRAAKDRSPLRIRALIGTRGKGDAASKATSDIYFFMVGVVVVILNQDIAVSPRRKSYFRR